MLTTKTQIRVVLLASKLYAGARARIVPAPQVSAAIIAILRAQDAMDVLARGHVQDMPRRVGVDY